MFFKPGSKAFCPEKEHLVFKTASGSVKLNKGPLVTLHSYYAVFIYIYIYEKNRTTALKIKKSRPSPENSI